MSYKIAKYYFEKSIFVTKTVITILVITTHVIKVI